jgi:hypothetical protein
MIGVCCLWVKKTYKSINSESAFFLKMAFIIIMVCLLCEIFVFNARHFITHWGDGQIDMHNTKYQLVNITRDG